MGMAWMASEGTARQASPLSSSWVMAGLVAEADMVRTPPGTVTSVVTLRVTPLKAGPRMAWTPTVLTRCSAARIGLSRSWQATMARGLRLPPVPPGSPLARVSISERARAAPARIGSPMLAYSPTRGPMKPSTMVSSLSTAPRTWVQSWEVRATQVLSLLRQIWFTSPLRVEHSLLVVQPVCPEEPPSPPEPPLPPLPPALPLLTQVFWAEQTVPAKAAPLAWQSASVLH